MSKKSLITLAVVFAVTASVPAVVYATSHTAADTAAKSDSSLAEGEVRRVDKETKKITIRHGPIESLEMPAMTMVFQVKDPAMLDQVKTGDKIKFSADKVSGAYTVTRIEAAK